MAAHMVKYKSFGRQKAHRNLPLTVASENL